ncbi:MAG: peptidase S41, partial [bacterium]|nr:peptidase S41 [bacterium]
MRFVLHTLIVVLVGFATTVSAQVNARMLRFPDVSATDIAFVYAGDVWVVAKEGGVAQRLSTPLGEESFPRFSPDGATLAFTGNYDGNEDIYTVPVRGGMLTRVTHHPAADRVLGWNPDGERILFATGMTSGKDRFNQLYQVSSDGGLPERLPLPYGEYGSIAEDGKSLAYLPLARDHRTWKRYRGGMAPDIWLFDLDAKTSQNLTQNDANDTQPMWYGRTLYFLSDRDENMRHNIWALDLDNGELRQVTRFEKFDTRYPAIGTSDIVFENAGR